MNAPTITDRGWAVFEVDDGTEALARETDEQRPARGTISRDGRWVGYLGEIIADFAFVEAGIPCKHNGGVDTLPDLEVEGLGGVEVKTRTLKRGEFRPEYAVIYRSQYLQRPVHDALLFTVWNEEDRTITIIGAASPTTFFSAADFTRAGGPFPGTQETAAMDFFQLPASQIRPFRQIVADLKSTTKGRTE